MSGSAGSGFSFFFLLLFFLNCCSLSDPPAAGSSLLKDPVKISSGLVSGLVADGVRSYKGIPYAAPPLGQLRFRPPQPVSPWQGVRKCTEYGPACLQPPMSRFTGMTFKGTSEDCLYLNVWAPVASKDELLPVMVWIHGGGFTIDSASNRFYDGQYLAQKGVVVVSFDYRLGPFGFFAHPLLSRESDNGVSGNYGLLDEIQALKWVKENIQAFGGDPGRVTIFGESAGGRSVALLMVSPLSRGLFHRAIIESRAAFIPFYHLRQSWYGRPPMEVLGRQVSQKLGCEQQANPLAALRAVKGEDILEACNATIPGAGLTGSQGNLFEPVVDGFVLPLDPSDLFDAGKQAPVPLIAGFNAREGSMFMPRGKPLSSRGARRLIRSAFPDDASELLRFYPFGSDRQSLDSVEQIVGDSGSACPIRNTVRDMSKVGAKAWLYYFTLVPQGFAGKLWGCYHGAEIPYVFNSVRHGRHKATAQDIAIQDAMSGFWVRFAASGHPDGPGLPQWTPYNRIDEPYLEFGQTLSMKKHLKQPEVDLHERIECKRRSNRKVHPAQAADMQLPP